MIKRILSIFRRKKEETPPTSSLETPVTAPAIDLTTIDIDRYIEKIGVKSEITKMMLQYAFAALKEAKDGKLRSTVMRDLAEAKQYGALDYLLAPYLVGLYDICKKGDYKKEDLCVKIANAYDMIKYNTRFNMSRKQAIKETKKTHKDRKLLNNLYEKYLEIMKGMKQ